MAYLKCAACGAEIRTAPMWRRVNGRLVPEHRDCGMYVTERSPEWALKRFSDFTAASISPQENERRARALYRFNKKKEARR